MLSDIHPAAREAMVPTIAAATEPVWAITGSHPRGAVLPAVLEQGTPQSCGVTVAHRDHSGLITVLWCLGTLGYGIFCYVCITRPSFQQGSGSRSRSWCSFSAPTLEFPRVHVTGLVCPKGGGRALLKL